MATLSHFTHNSQRFSIDYPENWMLFEQPNGVIVLEPDNPIGYTVVFDNVGTKYNKEELNRYLATFVSQNFVAEGSDFKAISHEQKEDGSIVARFSTLDPALEQTISQMHILQQNNVVFVVYFNAPAKLWDVSLTPLKKLTNTFLPLDTHSNTPVEATPTSVPPEWTLIGPPGKEFAFLVASDWETLKEEEHLISVGFPETSMTFTASNFIWPGANSNPSAAIEAALDHIVQITAKYSHVQHLPPTEFLLDTKTGATIDFIFTTDNNTPMAGSVITAVDHNKMHKIVFTAPTDFYDAALQWFNPMYKSFKFLSPDEGLPTEEVD